MSTATLDRPPMRLGGRLPLASPRASAAAGGPTLADVLSGAWEGLGTHRAAACPVCAGHMVPRYGASGVEPVGGRCTDCGTVLG